MAVIAPFARSYAAWADNSPMMFMLTLSDPQRGGFPATDNQQQRDRGKVPQHKLSSSQPEVFAQLVSENTVANIPLAEPFHFHVSLYRLAQRLSEHGIKATAIEITQSSGGFFKRMPLLN